MATELFKTGYGNSHTRIYWSKDWNTFEPWTHNGQKIPYFCKLREWNNDSTVCFNYWYIGPFAIVYARWVD